MKRYEAYKHSGVDWIGEIPEGWEVVKGKRLLFENKRAVRKEDEIVTCFRDGQVTLRRLRKTEGFTNSLKEIGYQGIRAGDLVVHNMDAFAGAIGIAEYDGKSTPVYSVCTERNNNTLHLKFYSYYLRNLAVRGLILSLAKGIRERSTDFRFSDLGDLDLPYPPLSEQTAIAEFLDDKTAKIDQTIGIRQKEIELLKERLQILIQQAVTGKWSMVNGQWLKTQTEKLKPSGVDWIGEIPEHWEVRKLKSLSTKIGDGLHGTPDYDDEGEYYFINGNNLGGNYISVSEITKKVNFNEFKKNRKELSEKSILLSINGTIGNVAFYRNELVMLGKSVCYVNLTNDVNKKFLAFYFKSQSFKEYCEVVLSGSTIYNLSLHSVANTKISLPFLDEQTQIVSYLEDIEAKIAKAIALKEQEIEKLKEYKTVLIDNVVTGKIKVC